MFIGVGVSSFSYLYVSFSGLITLIVDERANYFAIVYLLCGFYTDGFSVHLGA